jgi:hypothetical protein
LNETLTEFARELDAAWARGGRNPEAFPTLARDSLATANLHERIDPMDAVAWVFRTRELPRQYDPMATFGEPPVTVWRNEHFFIDMYFWIEPDIALHDHAFTGAFTNLVGESLHCVYAYDVAARPAPGVAIGELALDRVETFRPGSTSTIASGAAFIHRVWHLSRPTVTLVARTPRLENTMQARYFLPSLALNDPGRVGGDPERFQRQQQFIRYLAAVGHPDVDARCRELILGVSPIEAFSHLETYLHVTQKNADDWERCDALVEALAQRHGAWASSFGVALHTAAALRGVHWDRLVGFNERLLVALLQTYSSRTEILAAAERVRTELPSVTGTVLAWLRGAITSGGLTLKLSDAQIDVAMLLADGASDDAVIEQLSEEYELDDAARVALVELGQKLRSQPLIGKLLR